MEQYTNEELIEMIGLDAPILADKNVTKSKKALAIIGRLIMLSSLEENKKTGYVYRSNADLAADVDTDESTLRRLLRILENRGYVERRAGNRADNRASIYYLNWNKVNDVVPPYVQNSATPSATPLSTPSATPSATPLSTPSATPSVEEVLNALSLEIKEIKETLKRLEELVTTPSATPSSTPSSEKLPPPVIDIVIDKEIDIKKNGIIYNNDIKDNIEEKSSVVLDNSKDGILNKMIEKQMKLLYNDKNSVSFETKDKNIFESGKRHTIEENVQAIVEYCNKEYLDHKNSWEELQDSLQVALMYVSSIENNHKIYMTAYTKKEVAEIKSKARDQLKADVARRVNAMKKSDQAKKERMAEEIANTQFKALLEDVEKFSTSSTTKELIDLNMRFLDYNKNSVKEEEPETADNVEYIYETAKTLFLKKVQEYLEEQEAEATSTANC